MQPRIRKLLVALVAAAALAACGGGSGGGGGSPNATGNPPPTTNPPGSGNPQTADVVVTGSTSTPQVASGGISNYTMTVTNSGPGSAAAVTLEDVVDPMQTLTSITCTGAGGGVCPASLGQTMTVPLLPNGATLTFNVTATVSASALGVVSNTMYANVTGDPVASNNVATVTVHAAIPSTSGSPSFVVLQSDSGDYIGGGQTYSYTEATAAFNVTATGTHLAIGIVGNETWTGDFAVPNSLAQIQAGTYSNLTRYPFNDPAVGGLSWDGQGRGCNTLQGSFTVNSVTYANGVLAAVDLQFEQHCEGAAPALRGQIHWFAGDTTQPAGPVLPVPASLWRAPAGATPASGNYVYLQSDAGDYIGAGATMTYTQANAVLAFALSGGHLGVTVTGDLDWSGDFLAMNTLAQLQPGYYGGLQRFPFNNPVMGGLNWGGAGRGCNTLTGWFAVDAITLSGGSLASIDLRFEQHCEGVAAALHGQLHWVAGDTTAPPGPQNPPPTGLWSPAAGSTPASGNYVYLLSDSGDYIGQGQTYTYQPSNATVVVSGSGTSLTVTVNGIGGWSGNFVAMNSISQLQPGYYPNLERWPFNNPTLGGLNWSGYGRGCNMLSGWFAIDSLTFAGANVASIDLRFEQHCEGATPALHGKIHWIN